MDKVVEILDRYNMRKNDSRLNMESYDISCAKNDEERVKIALQYLSRNENPIDYSHKPILQCKSATIASEHIEKGNNAYQSLSWCDSFELYTKAVSYAEINSKELARAYGNRSAVLYEWGLYDDSLIDIERALKIGYNDDTKAKLYTRRAKCIYALEKKMTPEVIKAIADARKWLEKMNSIKKKLLMNILDEFPKNLSIKKVSTKGDFSKLMPKIPNDNPKIPGVSGAVTLNYSQEYGRHVVATKDINVGEVIMVQKFYLNFIMADSYYQNCANCCKFVFAGIPCHQCVNVIYCDENCRDEHWREYHDIECSVISAMIGNVISQNILTLRLTVKAYKEAGTFEKLQENIRKIDEINDPILKLFTNDVFDPTKFASVYSLWKPATISFQDALMSALILYSLAATTEIFGKKITTFKQLLKNKWAKFMSGLIMTNHRIISMNAARLNGTDILNVDPFWCLFNHSCDPSMLGMVSGNISASIAVQRIKKGEQIFTSYDPEFLMCDTNERRNRCKNFDFWCECMACIRNWGPDSHLTFPSYGVSDLLKNPEMEKKMLFLSNYNISEIFLSDIDVKLKMIQHIYDLLNFLQSTHGYPTKEIFALRILLKEIIASIH
ncbi:hypothetical protein PV328_006408 [Microctonus aethiopoides]|uniref:SET and MYND domain-containing protein 4 n=1 Tax=Microctonus aethiopoides TaxID=144406 RepID=A0AA39KTG9_9HYME|nr:hypothetical protein PV328_006408 [Microctonus aethiopoides]